MKEKHKVDGDKKMKTKIVSFLIMLAVIASFPLGLVAQEPDNERGETLT